MNRKIAVLLVAVFVIAALPLFTASARSANTVPAAQAATKCTDAKFLGDLSKDLTELGKTFKGAKMDDPASLAQALLSVAVMRQKYEDLTVPDQCFSTQLAAIISFANASDILALGLAIKSDPANKDAYAKVIDSQLTRFTKTVDSLMVEAGAATPTP